MQHFNNDLLRTVSKSLIIWYQKLLNWHFFVSPNQIHVVLCHDNTIQAYKYTTLCNNTNTAPFTMHVVVKLIS